MPPAMRRSLKLLALAALTGASALSVAACGTEHIDVAQQYHSGAVLFSQRCSGCHTLSFAATHGSASNIQTRERVDGPNFNVRTESVARVLYAIRNGGFSGAIMPQDIVVGSDAQQVAAFVAHYAGRKANTPPAPNAPSSGGASTSSGG